MTELFNRGGLQIASEEYTSEEKLQFAEKIILGTPGKLQYRHKEVRKKLSGYTDTSFYWMRRYNLIIGSVALARRMYTFNNTQYNCCLVRNFAINAPMKRADSPGKQKKAAKKNEKPDNLLKLITSKLFSDAAALMDMPYFSQPLICYATVEDKNIRSRHMVESHGLQQIRTLATIFFSRFYPKNKLELNKPNAIEISELKNLLQTAYNSYHFFNCDYINFSDNYFIYKINNRIVFGAQVHVVTWEILHIPGIIGFLAKHFLQHLPVMNKLINLKNFKYLSVDAIYIADNVLNKADAFFETLCHKFKATKMLFLTDTDSPLYNNISKIKNKGLLNIMSDKKAVHLYAKLFNCTQLTIEKLKENPMYTEARDSV